FAWYRAITVIVFFALHPSLDGMPAPTLGAFGQAERRYLKFEILDTRYIRHLALNTTIRR
ncbi:MAG: hypothetical protein L0G79_22545, partial [Pseudomonadales bacterium]|nr:hypothetical protein [Pseudomonadales bacterium]